MALYFRKVQAGICLASLLVLAVVTPSLAQEDPANTVSVADGIVPENTVFDAQINYAIPVIKSVLKVGAANLFGKDYIQVIGAGAIGQQIFASLTINP